MKSIIDPKDLAHDLSNSFIILQKDLKREKNYHDKITFPLDFSEIYGYLFPEFTFKENIKISRLVLKSKKTNIQYGLFPPTIAEFFLHFFKLYKQIEGYSNRDKKIRIGVNDISNYIMKMNPSKISTNLMETMTETEKYIHLIVTLSDDNIVQNSISNPCKNFKLLIDTLHQKGSLQTVKEIFPNEEERISFFKNKDSKVYNNVYDYLCHNPGRNPKKKLFMEDYNRIDALLAHQSYILNKYYYDDKNNFFSIFTSSEIPSAAMKQKTVLFPDNPFNNTPLSRSPIYLVCREAYLNNITDIDELIKIFPVSAELLDKIEIIKTPEFKFPNKDINQLLNSIFILLNAVFIDDNRQLGLKQVVMDSIVPRFSRYKVDEILDSSNNEKQYFELKSNIDDFINLEKMKYEDSFDKIQLSIKDTLIELYLDYYSIIEDSDFFSISPKMMEMKEKILFG